MSEMKKIECPKCGKPISSCGMAIHQKFCKGIGDISTGKRDSKEIFQKAKVGDSKEISQKAKVEDRVRLEDVLRHPERVLPAAHVINERNERREQVKRPEDIPFHPHIQNFERRVCAEIIDGYCENCGSEVDRQEELFSDAVYGKYCWKCGSKMYPQGKKPEKCQLSRSHDTQSQVSKDWLGQLHCQCGHGVKSDHVYCPGCGATLDHEPVKPVTSEQPVEVKKSFWDTPITELLGLE